MVILLEFIFQGFFEWIYSLILEIWNFFFASLLDIMTLDFAYIKAHVPVVEDIMEVFLAVGWALLLGNLVFQATRSMVSGLGFEGEDPKLLFARTFVFSFLLLACPQLCEIGLNLTSKIMTLLDVPDAINVRLVDGSIFGALTAAWLLVIIFDIILMFMVLKLLMEVAERYVILAVLTITAPLAFSMGGSKNTADIFAGWCRMFGSMCLLMVTNVMFFKMLLSVVSTVPSGLDVFPWMVLNVSIVKVAKKADEIITRIGLNPAITGDKGKGFGSALIYTVFRSAATKAVKVIGAAATGGASAAAGAAAGGAKAAAGAAGAAGAKGAAGGFFRFGRQWSGAQRPGSAKGQPAGSSSQSSSNGGGRGPADQTGKGPVSQSGKGPVNQTGKGPVSQPGQQSSSSRKSSVPQGARRGTSNVTGAAETSNTQPGGGFTGSGVRRTGGFSMGGRPGSGVGRETLRHSGRTGRGFGTGQRRGVDVYVDDDFNDGIVGLGGNFPPQGTSGSTPAGSIRRGQHSNPERTTPPAESTPREGGVRRGGGTSPQGPRQQGGDPTRPPEARSTRRGPSATPPTSGGGHTTSAGSASTTQTDSTLKQRSSSTVRQEQRSTSSAELSASQKGRGFASRLSRRPTDGPAGTRGGGADGTTSPRPKRQASGPARQESGKRPAPAATPARSSGAMAPPGQAGTGRTSYAGSACRSRDRSPSPARQELSRGAIPRGTLQRSGAPSIQPGLAGTGSRQIARTTSPMKQRSTSPVRQEPAKAPAPAGPPVKGGGSIVHTSGPPVRTDSPPRQRSTSPPQQKTGRPPTPAGPPVKGKSPIVRPGPAGTVKGPPPAKRTSRTKPDTSKQGGPNGKPGV